MRLARLDLLRYGRFTDAAIELPQAERDIHIVFGPNEAGKTTSLTAIEDLLFGIPERSPYGFLHGYDAMRVGAVLENGADRLEFQRRKSRRDTILGPDGEMLPGDERLLVPFLGGADRDYFDRMFNLSHGRLAEGGRAIIEAKDDVGQMLFAAGTGLADLRERLKQLDEEAEELWAPRRSERRLYYQAQDRLEGAQSTQREQSLTVNAWQKTRRTLSAAKKTLQNCREEHEAKSREIKKLARIRRVFKSVRQRNEVRQDLATLGDVVVLAEDAAEQLARFRQRNAEIEAKVAVLAPELEKVQRALEAISFDEALVRRANDIIQFNEQRIAVRGEQEDLPKRRGEYLFELKALAMLATEIGWEFEEPSELVERIPPRSKVEPVRKLLARHGEIAADRRNACRALEEAQAGLQEKKERLAEFGKATDVSWLIAVLNAVRSIGDVAGRNRTAQGQLAEISGEIEEKVRSLKPAPQERTDIEALVVPPRESIVSHREEMRELMQRRGDTKRQLNEAHNNIERDRQALDRRVRDEGLVAPGAVEEARGYRDTLWELIKAQYITHSEIPTEKTQTYAAALEDLPASLEGAVEEADSFADRRFDKAKAAGELTMLAHNIAGHETRVAQLEADETALEAEKEQLDQNWQALWAEVPIEVLAPDVMLGWLDARQEILALIGREREARRQLEDSSREENDAIAQIRTALTKIDPDAGEIKASSLRVMIERADAYRQSQEAKAEKIVEMREVVRVAKSEVAQRQRELEKAEAERQRWQEDWAKAVTAIDLQGKNTPELLSEQLNVIDEMRDRAATARDLREKRIATIERDVAAFERSVAKFVAELAPDLANGDAESAVIELDHRREDALKLHQKHRELTEAAAERRRKIEELEESRNAGWASLQPLLEAASVEGVEELREAIARSDRLRTLNEKLRGVMETLDQQGDGLAIEAIEEDCRDIDIDQVRVREEACEAELKLLGERREEAVVAHTDARKAFDAIGGDDTAARAAADRHEALAAMQDAAERYVRVRASGILLRWAVERYRKEKQGPLLMRAGELFRVLTRNSFERLEVAFDERDNMHLTGVRPDGRIVPVPGLSTGTEDQLFLALRIAAVEDYLTRAVALPFVADDLFINFDAERSAPGFEVLGQLAERTQVLFYTHHEHLVAVAQEELGADVHVVMLGETTQGLHS